LEAGAIPPGVYEQILAVEKKLAGINKQMNGDGLRTRYESVLPISLKARVDQITGSLWATTAAPTETYKLSYKKAADSFEAVLDALKSASEDIIQIESALEKYKAPYTPGRLPEWKNN
jgi:hypothetical protein